MVVHAQSLLSSEVPPRRYPLPLLPDADLVQRRLYTQVLRIGRNAAVCDIVIHDKTSKENALNVSRVRIHDVARVMLQFAPPSAPGRIAAD
jgi:hypothetical protein